LKIQTYFLVPKKKLSTEEKIIELVEFFYNTIIPVIATFYFVKTKNIFFVIPLLLPILLRIKIKPSYEKISTTKLKYLIQKKQTKK